MLVNGDWHSLEIDNETYSVNEATIFSHRNLLITFQASDLIRHIKSLNRTTLPAIADLECLDKQMSQEGKEFRTYNEWKVIHCLRHHKYIDLEFELKSANFPFFLQQIAKLYVDWFNQNQVERERFESIESRVNSVIYRRQFKGIKIDMEAVQKKCEELEREIYKIKNILQLEHRIFNPDDIGQQIAYLKSRRYKIIESPKSTFKIRRLRDAVCRLFYDLYRNTQDLESCIFMLAHWGGQEITYPSYFGFGTITSRITMRQPSLQNLRKVNRAVLVPDDGFRFLYIDYSQFEAGILASLSDDDQMIALYNTDIYTDLATNVLGDATHRTEAKIIFYRYMYGDDSLDAKAVVYFKRFKKLEDLRTSINATIETDKKIGTSVGNFRKLRDNESSWPLSHLVQGTASLIFKNALIQVNERVPEAEFLIPMHDGALYQIKAFGYEATQATIEQIYIEEFKKICPRLAAKVTCEDHF